MAVHRIFSLVLLFLAPFCIVGGMLIFKYSNIIFIRLQNNHISSMKNIEQRYFQVLSAFLLIFLLLNSGFVSEVVIKDFFPPAVGISKERIMQSENIDMKSRLLLNYLIDYDISSSQWMSRYRILKSRLYLSEWVMPSLCYYLLKPNESTNYEVLNKNTKIDKKAYIYLNYLNYVEGIMLLNAPFPQHPWYNTSEISPELDKLQKIYNNGGSVVYYS